MKKHLLFSVFIILLASLLCAASALGENTASGRKLTLMIYMCGSNLESGYGSASADIEEMKNAGLRGNDVTVLIMTGGSEQWAAGYDPSRCLIQELGPRGMRVVWRSDAMNMGEADTLTQLLRFGKESYPADDYALILWNHGGGPMEGVCWDELFSMDRMTLPELSSAISNADLGQKLSWIGFDACLMGSVEVAAALSPYAAFMIASEESEPSKGWDYSFLQGIASDASGAETGERIVNAYFSGNAGSNDTLTLTCLDLAKVQQVVTEMDSFFSVMDRSLNTENFTDVSNLRMRSVGFGRSVSENNDDDYDLVDLGDFVKLLGAESSADLLHAIQDAVVYARSTVSSSCGLSVYHPFVNKAKYTKQWKDEYDSLISCPGYTSYVRHYGNILTGNVLAVWNKLYTEKNANGTYTLQLTPEQLDNFSSAQLMILMVSHFGDSYMLVSSAPASVDENGLLMGSYAGRTLYAVTDSGGSTVGPLSFTLKPGIEGNIVAAVYNPTGKGLSANHVVAYIVENTEEEKIPAILQTRVFDTATETFTNRLSFSEENMSSVYFWHLDRIMPSDLGEGVLPGFFSWEDSNNIQANPLPLPQEWHFEYSDEILTGASLYAMFQIADSQQNLYCSVPVPVDNSVLSDIPLVSGSTVETDEYRIETSIQLNTSALDAGLHIQFKIHNLSDAKAKYQFSNIVLNDNRVTSSNWRPSGVIDPNDDFTMTYAIPAWQTYNISDPLTSFTAVLHLFRDADSYDYEEIPLYFDVEPISLSPISPDFHSMGTVNQGDVEIQLLSITPVICGLEVALYVNNQRDEDMTFNQILFDSIGMDDTISYSVPAHSSTILDIDTKNVLWKDSYEVSMPGVSDFHNVLLHHRVLQRAGLTEISRLDLIANPDTFAYSMEVFTLQLDKPWTLEEYSDDQFNISPFFDTYFVSPLSDADMASDKLLFYSRDEYSVSLQSIFFGEASAALTFRIENLTDWPMSADFRNGQFNHLAVSIPSYNLDIFIPPHSTRYTSVTVGTSRDHLSTGYEISSIQFAAVMNGLSEKDFPPISVELNKPAKLGDPNGIMLISSDFNAEPVETKSVKRPEWIASETQAADTEVRPFDPSVEVADVSQYTFRVKVPADLVDMSEISQGWVTIVDVIADNYLSIISHYQLEPSAEGILAAEIPSLYLCLADDPSLYVFHLASVTDGKIQYRLPSDGILYWSIGGPDGFDVPIMSSVTELTVFLDTFKGQAEISSYELDGELGQSQDDLTEVWLSTAEVWYEAKENGELPSITELSFIRGFDWYLSLPKLSLEGKPLKLALHALQGSGYSFLFSFERTDGSLFSLQPVPCDLLISSDE